MTHTARQNDPWGEFWSSKEGTVGGGCLPTRWDGIDKPQRFAWQAFARQLPRSAHVLDLATGDGRVMGWLLGARRDLKPLGVDLAPHIPQPPKGSRSIGGVAMEALPFGDGSHDAVTSQFGFEYGEPARVLSEIARVLRPGGRAGLMMHRLDGPILEHNLHRRRGLSWVLDDAGLLAKARGALAMRAVVPQAPAAISEAPAEAQRLFGTGSAGWELAEAIRQTLAFGKNDLPHNVIGLLGTLEAKARNEIGRIGSLEAACRAVADVEVLQRQFEDAGLTLESHRLVEAVGRPFADMWIVRRGAVTR